MIIFWHKISAKASINRVFFFEHVSEGRVNVSTVKVRGIPVFAQKPLNKIQNFIEEPHTFILNFNRAKAPNHAIKYKIYVLSNFFNA